MFPGGGLSSLGRRAPRRQAEVLRLLDVRQVETSAERISRPRGIVRLRRQLAEFDPDQLSTESDLEELFLELCSSEGLPRPRVNVPIVVDGLEVRPDFAWPEQRLIVELDSARFHSTPSGVERDKRRDQRLLLAGWATMRTTWTQLRSEPAVLASAIRRLLSDRTR
jgi:very-short-patch-repair endonuclease